MATDKERIKAARTALGINTAEFGKLLGISGRTVEDYEQGRRQPSTSVLKMLEVVINRRPKVRAMTEITK